MLNEIVVLIRKTREFYMREYRDKPTKFHKPSKDELDARRKRSIAMAIGLSLFMVFVFITMVSSGIIPNVS